MMTDEQEIQFIARSPQMFWRTPEDVYIGPLNSLPYCAKKTETQM